MKIAWSNIISIFFFEQFRWKIEIFPSIEYFCLKYSNLKVLLLGQIQCSVPLPYLAEMHLLGSWKFNLSSGSRPWKLSVWLQATVRGALSNNGGYFRAAVPLLHAGSGLLEQCIELCAGFFIRRTSSFVGKRCDLIVLLNVQLLGPPEGEVKCGNFLQIAPSLRQTVSRSFVCIVDSLDMAAAPSFEMLIRFQCTLCPQHHDREELLIWFGCHFQSFRIESVSGRLSSWYCALELESTVSGEQGGVMVTVGNMKGSEFART